MASTKPTPVEELEQLKAYATPTERAHIDALIAHGSHRKAAAALGSGSAIVGKSLGRVRRRAASQGWAPGYGWRQPVPEGFRVKAVSDKLNEDGERIEAWIKSERDTDPEAHSKPPPGHLITKTATQRDAQGNIRVQWTSTARGEQERWEAFERACKEHAENYAGLQEPTPPPDFVDDETLTLYPLGDPHLGLHAWAPESGDDFDLKIAERDMVAVLTMLVAQAPDSGTAILANLGDLFHADDDKQLTPGHGHKLDVDTRAAKVFRLGCTLLRALITLLLTKHRRVHVVNVPGNHDPMTARMIAVWLEAVFENEPRVTIEPNLNPFFYLLFGRVLFGFTHGDNCKPADLPEIMACDRSEDWGQTDFHIWHTGHVHHDQVKEYRAAIVETHGTLAARDYWHNQRGYRSRRALSRVTYHTLWGEISRGTVDLKLARASLVRGVIK